MRTGIRFHGGGTGHLVENNTISGNTSDGIMLQDGTTNGVRIRDIGSAFLRTV